MTKQKLIDLIAMMLGGRVSEEIFLDDITTGASSDINRATSIARKMVTDWGMSSKLGLIHYGSENSEVFLGRDYQTRAIYSEKEAAKIDDEIKKIIDSCYAEAKRILSENKDKVETMVEVLIEKETIYSDEVDMIMNGSTKEEVISYIDEKAKTKKQTLKETVETQEKTEVKADDFVNNLLKEAEKRAELKQEKINTSESSENEVIEDVKKENDLEEPANEKQEKTDDEEGNK